MPSIGPQLADQYRVEYVLSFSDSGGHDKALPQTFNFCCAFRHFHFYVVYPADHFSTIFLQYVEVVGCEIAKHNRENKDIVNLLGSLRIVEFDASNKLVA